MCRRLKYGLYLTRTLCVWLVYGLFTFESVYAQVGGETTIAILTDRVIDAQNESIVSLALQLSNQAPQAFHGYLRLKEVDGITIVGRDSIPVALDQKSSLYFPIRLSIGRSVPAGNTPVTIQLFDETNKLASSFTSDLLIQSISKVRLLSQPSTQLMTHVGDSIEVSAMLRNEGNNEEVVNITTSFPNMTGGSSIEQRSLVLSPFQDTVITFRKIITEELLGFEHYAVNIAALYEDGELINNILTTIQNASGSRTYHDPLHQGYSYDSYSPNSISVSSRNIFTQNEAIQINGRGRFQLSQGSLAFNLDSYIYTQNNLDPLLTNTFLNYERKNTGIVLGSINENLETYINGRGVKVYHRNEDETQSFEIGFADKSYNLLGNRNRIGGDNDGYTAFSRIYLHDPNSKKRYTGSLIYDRSDLEQSENFILMNDYAFPVSKDLSASVELGGGLTRLADEGSAYKPALSIGAALNGLVGEYSIGSNNFYSTGYYPGIRRGLLSLNERISRRLGKVNLWVGYNYYNYNPEYLKSYFFYNSRSESASLEAGTYFPITNNFSFSIAAKRQADEASIYSPIEMMSSVQLLNSWRFTETLNWRSKNDQHLINFTSENGFGRLKSSGKNQLQIRASILWNYHAFSVNGYYQQGDFTVREAFGFYDDRQTVRRFNIAPSFQKTFLDNRLRTSLSINFNRDSYTGNNWSLSTNNSYAFSTRFSGFINAYIYDYQGTTYSSSFVNAQTGITYKLPTERGNKPGKKGNIRLFLFFDNNANGIYDDGDIPASERIVTIGDVTFVSQSDGSVIYKKVPYGTYDIDIPSSHWYASAPEKINLCTKECLLNIPLQETGKVTGNFEYNYDQRTSEEINDQISGLRVWLIDKDGNRISALSNTDGEFTLFAPIGEYTLQVDDSSLPNNVYTDFKAQDIRISKEKSLTVPTIELKVKQKKIEVKRFSS